MVEKRAQEGQILITHFPFSFEDSGPCGVITEKRVPIAFTACCSEGMRAYTGGSPVAVCG